MLLRIMKQKIYFIYLDIQGIKGYIIIYIYNLIQCSNIKVNYK